MQVEFCEFPDDLYYDTNNDVWINPLESGKARVGITTILSFLAGRFSRINLKTDMTNVVANQSIATVESVKYFGAIRSPLRGKISLFNNDVQSNPRLANDSPYELGWIAEYAEWAQQELSKLQRGEDARLGIQQRIKDLRIRCFRLLPHEEMNSVGLECAATLTNLNELLAKSPVGTVVHVISDDPLAEIEMIRWQDQTKNELAETRKEGNLYHFVVRKTH